MTNLPRERWQEPHFVYRLWSHDDVSLYVGMTNNVEVRLSVHRKQSLFCRDIDRVDVTEHPSRIEATRVESAEIRRLRPRYNIAGRGSRLGWTACDYFEAIEHHSSGPDGGAYSDTLPRLVREFGLRFPNVAEQTLPVLGLTSKQAS